MAYSCLIIEDCNFIREIYYLNLKGSAVNIIAEAKNGREGLEKIRLLKPDLIILDLVLPEVNGFDILSQVHQLSPNSRVLVISTMEDISFKQKAKSLGAIGYLEKPFSKSALLSAVQEAAQHYDGVQNG